VISGFLAIIYRTFVRRTSSNTSSHSEELKTKNLQLILLGPALLLLPLGALHAADLPNPPAPNPHLIEILVDDLGYGDLGVYGSEIIKTPHIDALAASGVRFTSGYVTTPWCAPSRHALLSGSLPNRRSSFDRPWMGDYLQKAGYATGFIGKVHSHKVTGFDYFYGFFNGSSPYLPGGAKPLEMLRSERAKGEIKAKDCERVVEREYLTDGFSREAVDFIGRNKEHRFALCLHYNAPHGPLEASEEYLARYPKLEGNMKIYAAMVSAIDDGVGRIIEKLKADGLYENTLITFLSDNGPDWIWGRGFDKNHAMSGGLRNSKHSFYEGGIRIPYIVSWPGRLPQEVTSDRVVSSMDLLPTFLSAAGISCELDRFDGVNLLPFLTDSSREEPHPALFFQRSLSGLDLGVSQEHLDRRSEKIGDTKGTWMIRTADWKLLGSGTEPLELYDLKNDRGELENRLTAQSGEVRKWTSQYLEFVRRNGEDLGADWTSVNRERRHIPSTTEGTKRKTTNPRE
jgi:arylsulfatase A-like enzyme